VIEPLLSKFVRLALIELFRLDFIPREKTPDDSQSKLIRKVAARNRIDVAERFSIDHNVS